MNRTKYCFKQLDANAAEEIRELFVGVFTKEPWNDDWSDERQLQLYLHDLTGQDNSLTFGLYEGTELIGLSLGHIRHWYSGTEYCIDEFCIRTVKQGKGVGTFFVKEIEKACRELGFMDVFLLTENNVPAYEFYKRQGFCESETNVLFAKKL